ncbi:MAG: sigma 54-interacting transcriptional regulator [Myxococcales bacterium]|nr:sigma 54-interacting transcriptional regulator [Myxococcales bacterium]
MSEGTHIGTRAASPLVASPDGAMVVVLSGSKKGTTFRIGADARAVVKVGKAPDNDIVLDDDTVSRHHLTVARVPEGLLVRDLGSTNGVRVGGARIKEALVDPGTVVRAGEVELAIRLELSGVEVPASSEKRFGTALGQSLAMRRIFGLLERIAPTVATVLLTGETGTGKDVLARSIHEKSPRASASFEVVDCGAVAHNLIESELFGHERGAFTGAIASRAGAFERAAGGTVFLDEVGELPLELQPKLLRVLEAKELRRVGGNKTLTTDARVVAATTRDLARDGAARQVPRGPVLPPGGGADPRAAAPRARRGHRDARAPHPRRGHARGTPAAEAAGVHPGRAARPRLAGQRARAAQRARARGLPRARGGRRRRAHARDAHRRAPPGGRRRPVRLRPDHVLPRRARQVRCPLRAPLRHLAARAPRRQHLGGGARGPDGPQAPLGSRASTRARRLELAQARRAVSPTRRGRAATTARRRGPGPSRRRGARSRRSPCGSVR